MARKHYLEYPPTFLSILDHFLSSDEPIEYDLAYSDAISTRHYLYRFFGSVKRSSDEGPQEAMLSSIARKLSISVIPSHAPSDRPVKMRVYVTPLEALSIEPRRDEREDAATDLAADEIERVLAERKKER